MWHACKQRAFALLGLQKCSTRTPFGVPPTKEQSVKPRYSEYGKIIANYQFNNGKDTQGKWRNTCDDRSKNFHHLHYSQWLETLSWVGTAFALGLNYKLCSQTKNPSEKKEQSCFCRATDILLHLALSMPKTFSESTKKVLSLEASLQVPHDVKAKCYSSTISSIEESRQALEDSASEYFSELENLAGLELIKTDKGKAFTHFLLASDLGSAKGSFNAGICYETGQGTVVNFKKAAHHYALAAKAGHSSAAYNLGVYYMEGREGIEKDPEQGIRFLHKAADLGVGDAQYYLGICYQEGLQVEQDLEIAIELFYKAASSGHEGAINATADLSALFLKEDDQPLVHNEEVKFTIEPPIENPVTEVVLQKDCEPKQSKVKAGATTFHISASSPDLHIEEARSSLPNETIRSYEIAISRYLDIILPYHWIPEHSEEMTLKTMEVMPKVPVPNNNNNNVMKVCIGM